jgi:Papain family cysteine protease/Cathepsin propeptide inhibitor domain (I29)
MKAVSTLLVSLMAISSAFWVYRSIQKQHSVPKSIVTKYALWKTQFGKLYSTPQEDQYRLSVFGSNVDTVARMNAQYDAYLEKTGEQALKEPMFVLQSDSDLSNEEFKKLRTGFVLPEEQVIDDLFDLPQQIAQNSLQQVPYTLKIREQLECGSCWAFSTVATLEKMYFDLNGVQVDLSQQYLVDCSSVNNGCSGGSPQNTYLWVNDYDIVPANVYPYRAVQGVCKRSSLHPNQLMKFAGKITSTVWKWSEEAMLKVVDAHVIAGTVVYSSGGFRFVNKNDDIFDPMALNECQSPANHALNLVSMGVDSRGMAYAVIQNSWGYDWGNRGLKKFRPCGSSLHGVPSMISHAYKHL